MSGFCVRGREKLKVTWRLWSLLPCSIPTIRTGALMSSPFPPGFGRDASGYQGGLTVAWR